MPKFVRPLFLVLCALLTVLTSAPASSGYAAGSKLAVKIACPSGPSSDPNFVFTLTNLGSTPIDVSTQTPIDLKVHLTVKDSTGSVVQPGDFDSGMRSSSAPRILDPGKSLELKDWVRHDQPQTSVIPLHLFGYKLSPGTYAVSAKATNSPDEHPSNVCEVVIN